MSRIKLIDGELYCKSPIDSSFRKVIGYYLGDMTSVTFKINIFNDSSDFVANPCFQNITSDEKILILKYLLNKEFTKKFNIADWRKGYSLESLTIVGKSLSNMFKRDKKDAR